mmetsp:Transcript_12672/g.16394  ORF Transcript_12672/g.16394 Transcript_12672/m.16394 type:complete len:746 (+) Transcript_12672:102-2339(+)
MTSIESITFEAMTHLVQQVSDGSNQSAISIMSTLSSLFESRCGNLGKLLGVRFVMEVEENEFFRDRVAVITTFGKVAKHALSKSERAKETKIGSLWNSRILMVTTSSLLFFSKSNNSTFDDFVGDDEESELIRTAGDLILSIPLEEISSISKFHAKKDDDNSKHSRSIVHIKQTRLTGQFDSTLIRCRSCGSRDTLLKNLNYALTCYRSALLSLRSGLYELSGNGHKAFRLSIVLKVENFESQDESTEVISHNPNWYKPMMLQCANPSTQAQVQFFGVRGTLVKYIANVTKHQLVTALEGPINVSVVRFYSKLSSSKFEDVEEETYGISSFSTESSNLVMTIRTNKVYPEPTMKTRDTITIESASSQARQHLFFGMLLAFSLSGAIVMAKEVFEIMSSAWVVNGIVLLASGTMVIYLISPAAWETKKEPDDMFELLIVGIEPRSSDTRICPPVPGQPGDPPGLTKSLSVSSFRTSKNAIKKKRDGIEDVLEALSTDALNDSDVVDLIDDEDIPVRWLMACDEGDTETALQRWRNSLEWRISYKTDTILERPPKNYFLAKSLLPSAFLGISKAGHLVTYDYIGKIKSSLREMKDGGISAQDFAYHCVFLNEYWIQNRITKTGSLIKLVDLQGLNVFSFSKDVLKYISPMNVTLQNYPETLTKIYFLNAPQSFRFVWRIVERIIPKKTLEKIVVTNPNNAAVELQNVIDVSVLPRQFGGEIDTDVKSLSNLPMEKELSAFVEKAMKA